MNDDERLRRVEGIVEARSARRGGWRPLALALMLAGAGSASGAGQQAADSRATMSSYMYGYPQPLSYRIRLIQEPAVPTDAPKIGETRVVREVMETIKDGQVIAQRDMSRLTSSDYRAPLPYGPDIEAYEVRKDREFRLISTRGGQPLDSTLSTVWSENFQYAAAAPGALQNWSRNEMATLNGVVRYQAGSSYARINGVAADLKDSSLYAPLVDGQGETVVGYTRAAEMSADRRSIASFVVIIIIDGMETEISYVQGEAVLVNGQPVAPADVLADLEWCRQWERSRKGTLVPLHSEQLWLTFVPGVDVHTDYLFNMLCGQLMGTGVLLPSPR